MWCYIGVQYRHSINEPCYFSWVENINLIKTSKLIKSFCLVKNLMFSLGFWRLALRIWRLPRFIALTLWPFSMAGYRIRLCSPELLLLFLSWLFSLEFAPSYSCEGTTAQHKKKPQNNWEIKEKQQQQAIYLAVMIQSIHNAELTSFRPPIDR